MLPSIRTLSQVFSDPKQARAILEMNRAQLEALPAGAARVQECYHAPTTPDVRLHCLAACGELHGVEGVQSQNGEWADYLNAGDTYAPTLIRWRGRYRVQSLGDFIETMERQHVNFD